jgi:hypothetical protein
VACDATGKQRRSSVFRTLSEKLTAPGSHAAVRRLPQDQADNPTANEGSDSCGYPGLHFGTMGSSVSHFIDFPGPRRARRSSGGCASDGGATRRFVRSGQFPRLTLTGRSTPAPQRQPSPGRRTPDAFARARTRPSSGRKENIATCVQVRADCAHTGGSGRVAASSPPVQEQS